MAKTKPAKKVGKVEKVEKGNPSYNDDDLRAATSMLSISHRRPARSDKFEAAPPATRSRQMEIQLFHSIRSTVLQLLQQAAADKAARRQSLLK